MNCRSSFRCTLPLHRRGFRLGFFGAPAGGSDPGLAGKCTPGPRGAVRDGKRITTRSTTEHQWSWPQRNHQPASPRRIRRGVRINSHNFLPVMARNLERRFESPQRREPTCFHGCVLYQPNHALSSRNVFETTVPFVQRSSFGNSSAVDPQDRPSFFNSTKELRQSGRAHKPTQWKPPSSAILYENPPIRCAKLLRDFRSVRKSEWLYRSWESRPGVTTIDRGRHFDWSVEYVNTPFETGPTEYPLATIRPGSTKSMAASSYPVVTQSGRRPSFARPPMSDVLW